MERDEKNEYEIKNLKKNEIEEIKEIEKEISKLKDPTVHASIMYAVLRERENTNLILKNILQRIEALEEKIREIESSRIRKISLSEIDRAIISYAKMKENKEITAKEIQKIFKYRKRNAACARLSRLSDLGYFERKRVGKEVYYVLIGEAAEVK